MRNLGSSDETANLEDLLQLAIAQAKSGNKQGARVLLEQVLEADKQNDRAWLWMAYTSSNEVDRRRYLRTVLRLNPNNKAAQEAINKMQNQRVKSENRTKQFGILVVAILIFIIAAACLIVIIAS
jgi:thioredoxin-like negative regulator of GroEL